MRLCGALGARAAHEAFYGLAEAWIRRQAVSSYRPDRCRENICRARRAPFMHRFENLYIMGQFTPPDLLIRVNDY